MKRIVLLSCLIALLTACTVDDAESYDAQPSMFKDVQYAVFDGEWTVNKQVVDTARLEESDILRLRLPEEYLALYCFEEEMVSAEYHLFEYKGKPVEIRFKNQGYSTTATFSDLVPAENSYSGWGNFCQATFTMAIDGVEYSVNLLSDVTGSVIYKHDTGLWTISIPISSFLVTNMETQQQEVRTPHTQLTIYYNATKRIR